MDLETGTGLISTHTPIRTVTLLNIFQQALTACIHLVIQKDQALQVVAKLTVALAPLTQTLPQQLFVI